MISSAELGNNSSAAIQFPQDFLRKLLELSEWFFWKFQQNYSNHFWKYINEKFPFFNLSLKVNVRIV